MAPLATAFVRLRADSSSLNGDVRHSATRAGVEGGTVMGREFSTAFRRATHVLIGLGIGTFAVQAGRFAIDMADKFELSRSRIEQISKNLGGNFEDNARQVQALDNRMAALGFTSADVEGSVASLLATTKDMGEALKDVGLAADIARGRNISLEEATRILQRVETGHVAMLSRLGIQTKDATGHILSQKQAMEQLAEVYGGNATRFAGTFAGKQQALRAELANSAAEIGVALLPAAVDLAHVLQRSILPAVQSTAEWFDRNRKTIEPLVGTIIKLTLAYKAFKAVSKISGALAAGGAAKAAEGAAIGEAASLAKPLPVYVVNWAGGNGSTPPVTPTTAGEAEQGASRLSRFGRGALQIASVVPFAAMFGEFWAKSFTKYGFGIPGVFHVGGQKNIDPEGNLAPGFRKQVDALGGIDKALAYYKKLNLAASWEQDLDHKTKSATLSLKEQATALGNLQTKALALSQGQDDLRQAIHNMAVTAGSQASRALKGNSDAALANRDALRGAVSAAEGYLQTLKQHGASASRIAGVELGLARAIKKSAINTYGDRDAVDALLGKLGFLPSQINAVTDALIAMDTAWNPITGSEHRGLSDFAAGTSSAAKQKQAGVKAGLSFGSGYTPVVDKASTTAANTAQQAFQSAASKMRSDLSTILSDFRSERDSLLSSFSSLQTSGTDVLGASGPGQSIVAQLRQDAEQMHTFARLWHRLDELGLDPRLLAQFAGPDYIPAMRELLRSGRAGVRRADRFERSIARDAAGIARTDTLTKDGQTIHHDLDTLPRKLRKELLDGLHHAKFTVEFDNGRHDRHNGRKVRQH